MVGTSGDVPVVRCDDQGCSGLLRKGEDDFCDLVSGVGVQ